MNFWECFPAEIGARLRGLNNLREIRLRNGKPLRLNVDGKWFWMGQFGQLLCESVSAPVYPDTCENFVKKACNSSVYAYEKMLANGFFTLRDGSRVGVCGTMGAEGVFKNYSSLCVRVAKHTPFSCETLNDSFVVAGPPRSGKTTFLRDFAIKTSQNFNVAVADERGEISCCHGFENACCDVFLYASKKYALEVAVRSMSADWIVCDEFAQSELPLLENALASGVKVAASVHAENLSQVQIRLGNALRFFGYVVLLQKDFFSPRILPSPFVNLSDAKT